MTTSSRTQEPPFAILLIHCPDQQGLVASVTDFIYKHHGNILSLEEHVDRENGVFFMRVAWDLQDFTLPRDDINAAFQESIADSFQLQWTLHISDHTPRVAIFVSKLSHCLYDMLSRYQSGEWNIAVPLIISNHDHLKPVADQFGIEFRQFPITAENKAAQETAELTLLAKHKIDLIVLARYMQTLTDEFVSEYPNNIINIHHSFLPAFPGAKPYHSAHARGVKIIGVTSHYVTADLDAGPIIEQDVVPVSHQDSVQDMIRHGRDLEKIVLARAVWHHTNHQILVYDNRTIVFA